MCIASLVVGLLEDFLLQLDEGLLAPLAVAWPCCSRCDADVGQLSRLEDANVDVGAGRDALAEGCLGPEMYPLLVKELDVF